MNTDLREKLDMAGDTALYEQLTNIIRGAITDGTLGVGDMLPSESELCAHYGVSRSTVRQAMAELEQSGLVIRQRGKGSFVSQPKVMRSLQNLYSFTDEIAAAGLEPTVRVIAFELITPGEEIRQKLALTDEEEKVFSITRLRCAGVEPLSLEMALIPQRLAPFLTQELVEAGSLYKTLASRTGMQITHADETYEAALLGENEAAILGTEAGTCAFFVQRVSYTEAEEIFEYTVMIVRSDRCKYEVELTADDVQLSRKVE